MGTSLSILNKDELYQHYLAKVYQHTYANQKHNIQISKKDSHICLTYGELLYPSVKKILRKLALRPSDIFLDLGSGLGKCALQVFMQTDVQQVIGIEASSFLNQQANQCQEVVKNNFPSFWDNERLLSFICDNFLNHSWQKATAIYTCSTCFTQELLVCIGNKINASPHVQQVLSLRPLPTLALPLKAVFSVECSWDSALCFHYTRRH